MSFSGDWVLVKPSRKFEQDDDALLRDGHEVVVFEPIEGTTSLRSELPLHDDEGLPDELSR
jgi:hypothetical protein